jgi:hypothetical protein
MGSELLRRHKADHRVVLAGRLEVLPDRQEIDLGRAQVVHELQDLVPLLAQTYHDAGLGNRVGSSSYAHCRSRIEWKFRGTKVNLH